MNGHLAIGKLDPFLLFNHGHNIWCPQKIQNNILYWIRIWKVNIGQKTVKLYGSNGFCLLRALFYMEKHIACEMFSYFTDQPPKII